MEFDLGEMSGTGALMTASLGTPFCICIGTINHYINGTGPNVLLRIIRVNALNYFNKFRQVLSVFVDSHEPVTLF